MDIVPTQNKRFQPLLAIAFLLFIGSLSTTSIASATTSSPLPGTQLAYFIGHHSYNGGNYRPRGVYYRPRPVYYRHGYRHRNPYWGSWRYVGHGCKKRCLIDWRGHVIRCKTRCR